MHLIVLHVILAGTSLTCPLLHCSSLFTLLLTLFFLLNPFHLLSLFLCFLHVFMSHFQFSPSFSSLSLSLLSFLYLAYSLITNFQICHLLYHYSSWLIIFFIFLLLITSFFHSFLSPSSSLSSCHASSSASSLIFTRISFP